MSHLAHDFRNALRSMAAHPRFSAATVAMLAMGIALNAVVFAVVYGTLLRPLPYPDPGRLVQLSEVHPGSTSPLRDPVLSEHTFNAWRGRPRALEAVAGYAERAYTVSGAGDAERVRATAVSPDLFGLLRVRPAAGEFFSAAHATAGADAVVVLSHSFWRDRLGEAPDTIGRRLMLDGRPHLILGVAPPGFSFPDRDRALFTPLVPPRPDPFSVLERRPTRVIAAIARLAPSATVVQAALEGTMLARNEPRPPSANLVFGEGGPVTVNVEPLAEQMTAAVRPTVWLLAAGAAVVLVVTTVNVGGLALVRNVARTREFAIHAALGAERGRLLRRVVVEGIALSVAAGAVGATAAFAVLIALPAFAPASVPRLGDIQPDAVMLAYTAIISLIVGTSATVVPALRFSRTPVLAGLRGEAPTHTAVTRRFSWLPVIEVALAALLMVGAGLLVRSLLALTTIDAGYAAANVVTARITLQGSRDLAQRWPPLAQALVERLRGIDGVEQAAASNMAPFGDTNHLVGFYLPGDRPVPVIARTLGYVVTPGYFETLGIALRQGRLFNVGDAGTGSQPVIVNDEFARQYIGGGTAIGQQYFNTLAPNVLSEIVGVVGNVLKDGSDRSPQPELYVLAGHQGAVTMGRQINLVIRSRRDAAALAGFIRETVRAVGADAAVHNISTLDTLRWTSLAQPRLTATVLMWFAAAALALATAGLYSVLSYAVSRRARELAIRAAIGANARSLRWLVLRQALQQAAVGLAIGLTMAAWMTQSLESLLFQVRPLDPWAFGTTGVVLATVTVAASLFPASRASRPDLCAGLRPE